MKDHAQVYLQQGYNKVWKNDKINPLISEEIGNSFQLIIDRVTNNTSKDNQSRILDSLELAFHEGKGMCQIIYFDKKGTQNKEFSNLFEKDGILFEIPTLDFFSFNNPYGACKKCEGFGKIIGIDPELVIPNPNLSIYEDAIVCWRGEK